jgi:hypothetical protein
MLILNDLAGSAVRAGAQARSFNLRVRTAIRGKYRSTLPQMAGVKSPWPLRENFPY